MKSFELTLYLPQPKRRRINPEAVVFIIIMAWAAVVLTTLLIKLPA